jgi:hypothetical protein
MTTIRNPIAPWVIDRINRRYPGATVRPIEPGEKHEAGCTYWCGYWQHCYTVESVEHNVPVWDTLITSRWDDGETTTHATPLDAKYDLLVVPAL